MAAVSYTAKRELISGVSANDARTLAIDPREPFSKSRNAIASAAVSMSGRTQTTYIRGEWLWPMQTMPMLGPAADEMIMFLASVEDGQVFQFAPYDDPTDSPIDYRDVVLETRSWQPQQEASTGSYATDLWSFQFTLREV